MSSVDSSVDLSELEKFEYIQLVVHNIHCASVGRIFSKDRIRDNWAQGIMAPPELCYRRIDGRYVPHPLLNVVNVGNKYFKPDISTLVAYPAPDGRLQNVGRVLCDLEFLDGKLDRTTPRAAAMTQLGQLGELGFILKSAFETEFVLADPHRTPDPTETWQLCSMLDLDQRMDFFMELLSELKRMNIVVDSLQTESDQDLYELTLDLAEGLQAADGSALLKNHVKAFARRKGYIASFMSKDDVAKKYGTGLHFNHSLWMKDGTSAFLDKTQEDQLSDTCRHWLAGVVRHGPGMTALCAPTVNCYGPVLHHPPLSNWSIMDKRASTFVVRKTRGDNLYIEDRLPSGASNPYLVMAATVAAGLDGIRNKLQLPTNEEDLRPLPQDLDTALTCLQEDTAIVDALGHELVELFVANKKAEINLLTNMGNKKDTFENEYILYFQNA